MRKLISIVLGGLLLAACGSSNSSSSSGAGPSASSSDTTKALAFSQCMRKHGVPNFPDPPANGQINLRVQASPNGTTVNGVTVNGPAFQSAMQACRADLPNGGQPGPASAARRTAMLQFAKCMRAHGLPNFPDPTFGSGGGVELRLRAGAGIDPSAPGFKAAQAACGSVIQKVSRGLGIGG